MRSRKDISLEESIGMLKRIVSACIAMVLAWTVCTAAFGEAEEVPAAPQESAAEPAETNPEPPAEKPETPEQSEAPAEDPESPAEEPEQPAENPEAPADAPEQPAEDPETPAEKPEQPAENPETPAEPEIPAENPETPAEQPETPAENPETPAQEPETPAENPEAPVSPEQPAETPEQPAETPAEEPAQEPAAEAPVCNHESTTVVYYFDFPDYRPLDAENHVVFGRAAAEVRCTICGAVLSEYMEDNAEEICAHVFQKGRCALCGKEQEIAPSQPEETAAPAVRESVVYIPPAEDNPSQYFCALTSSDLEDAGDTLVLRPDGCDTALVVQAERLRAEIEKSGGGFIAEIERPGQRNVSATLRMYTADGTESVPEWQEISLRIYEVNNGNPLVVSYTSVKGTTSSEEAGWVGHGTDGYWNVTWLGNGIYEY